jgi:chromosome segregation protein
MRLTRLRLHGFKSFVETTDIPIEPGVTGIIGPNGCGKSNLVEALRFVMGESSYKAMRGGGMEDVIFSGAGNRPARNLAEVTLVAEREAEDGDGEEMLEITRRIERDAGSIYRMNGREVRARDVQILFADAATGAHSSALVRQGQIAELIAAKPEKRRGILEDAAGVSGLHARRNEAESKLKAAEQNLERLDDVMNEIGGRLEALRRQARQAVRYRKLSGEIRQVEAMLAALHWDVATARLAEAEAELSAAAAAFAAASARQSEAVRDEAIAAKRLPDLRDKAAAAASALQRLRLGAEELAREEARLKARREELTALRAQTVADLSNESEIAGDAAAAEERIDAESAVLREAAAGAAEAIAAARQLADQTAAAAAAIEVEFSSAAAALAAAGAERAARERSIREAESKLRRLEEERNAVLGERERLSAEQGDHAGRSASEAALSEAETLLAARERELEAAESALATARETERRARAPHEAAERVLGAHQAEARALAELLDVEETRRFPPLIDGLEIAPGYERALVAALGDDLEASLDPGAPAHWGLCLAASDDPQLPDGAVPLKDFVKGPENLSRRLMQVGVIAESAASALQSTLAPGQRLVSREGGLWRWDGFSAQAGSAAAGARRLEQRSRAAAVAHELSSARAAAEQARELLDSARRLCADAERIEAENRRAVRDARKVVDARRTALIEAERRHSRIVERLSAFAGALARIEADTDATRTELRAAADALGALADTTDLKKQRDDLHAELTAARGRAGTTRLDAEKAAHEETLRARRLAELDAERERWTARASRAAERRVHLEERLDRLDRDIAALADDPEKFEQRRRVVAAEIDAAEAALAEAADVLAAAEAEHRAAAEAARGALEALSQVRETRARDEERLIAARDRKEELAIHVREQFGCTIDKLRELAGLTGDAHAPPAEAVDSRLQKLKAERERLGGVNLRAEEEARELEERLDAMSAERRDLDEAIKRLRHGIQSLNQEGRERLLAAFGAVNGHFNSLFQHLFGGGTAELSLIGSDDPLEAGLEITARPPGKRQQTMTLLSGGEQALTALSLIFAVFLTNPSPICVLDEVDAPLDDANVERFCDLLDDMRRRTDTRFVVVTHNPITMARMDRLYGVTMAERGVSQIVSVDLGEAEQFREAS